MSNELNQTNLPDSYKEGYTEYNNYQSNRLATSAPEKKQVPNTGPEAKPQPTPAQYYHQIPLLYNYGVEGVKNLNDFMLEGPVMKSNAGIVPKVGSNGRSEYSIMVKMDPNIPEMAVFINTMKLIHGDIASFLFQVKGQVGMGKFDPKNPEALLKLPIYYPVDKMSGDVIEGRHPSMFLKLYNRGKPPLVDQTLFTDLNGNKVPWEVLTGVEMEFVPLIHIKRLYIGGGKASIQMEVVSALLTSPPKPRGTTSKQLLTANRLKEQNPELADQIAAQVAKLSIDRQDQMLNNNQTNDHPDSEPENQPTFSGITSSRNQPTMGSLPMIPQLNAPQSPSIQELTSNAPVRQQIRLGIPSTPSLQLN